MSGQRIPGGTEIDRSRALHFDFDGQRIAGFAGDTIASALIAAGVSVVGRSFKYHRPRGIWGWGPEEPNAIVDVTGDSHRPNCRATLEPARDGLTVRSVNGWPDAARDRLAVIDRFARFLPAGFYYKTFLWPNWRLFEPGIRAMAGLGRVRLGSAGFAAQAPEDARCDLLVVGAGPAGVLAALSAAEAGRDVVLVEQAPHAGGSLRLRQAQIDGMDGAEWLRAALARLAAAGARVWLRTCAFGVYDHGLVGLAQGVGDGARLVRLRPRQTILATGAIERGLPFANNDRPGVMSAEAALAYLRLQGALVGRRVAVALASDAGLEPAQALAAAGAEVTLIDARGAAGQGALPCLSGRIAAVQGRDRVRGVTLDSGASLAVDTVLLAGGHTPSLHLYAQAGGKPAWDDRLGAFVPGHDPEGLSVIGAAAGHLGLRAALTSAAAAVQGTAPGVPDAPQRPSLAVWPQAGMKGRVWVDLQNDVTAKDVELAAREGFASVEHLKRYTTLGMATDQGKTSNLAGLALLAEVTGRSIPDTGTTTFRPPFVPVPLATLAGLRAGPLVNPLRRLALEGEHRAAGATLREAGGWLRPAFYGAAPEAIQSEALQARLTVALADASPLGKIEIFGPDAAAFLDFVHYNTVSTLSPGRCRYVFVLTEGGILYDDGVLLRQGDEHFILSCSSSHVAGMHAHLEAWRQDQFPQARVMIHDTTPHWATLTVSGPKSRAVVAALASGLALDDGALPHMAFGWGRFAGTDLRVARVSFTGDRSYELSIRADRARALWLALREAGAPQDMTLLGGEALMILRVEKGYPIVGIDTDGATLPMDMGMSAPLTRKRADFIGRRSLMLAEAQRQDRPQFVGLAAEGAVPLPTGAHVLDLSGPAPRSDGFVTSSRFSPFLRRPVALAQLRGGAGRLGERVVVQHMGQRMGAVVVAPDQIDPEGGRLNAG